MRRLREAKGVKQETIAHITKVSGPQVSKIEAGKKRATRSFVEIVDDPLEADGALISLWEDLNKDGHPVPVWFDWPKIESDAAMLVVLAALSDPRSGSDPGLCPDNRCMATRRPQTLACDRQTILNQGRTDLAPALSCS